MVIGKNRQVRLRRFRHAPIPIASGRLGCVVPVHYVHVKLEVVCGAFSGVEVLTLEASSLKGKG